MSNHNGEPAFPSTWKDEIGCYHEGMSLRDWFAGVALQGLAPRYNAAYGPYAKDIAVAAYILADAMLEQGSKK